MASFFFFLCLSVVVVAVAVAYPYYNDVPEWMEEYLADREIETQGNVPQVNPHWPNPSVKLGQVAGVEAAPGGEVLIFHRGSRRWGTGTFLNNNSFANPAQGPITEDTIVTVNGRTGRKVSSMGANMFYMPHGLSLDSQGNIWVTDVALHQVMRIPQGADKPDLTLGEKLKPGNDDTHFCKPTDVAVTSSGDFFVADGYCNSRIIKFSKDNKVLKIWGQKVTGELTDDSLNVPHSLALVEEEDMICVADREDARVQCYNAGMKDSKKTGDFMTTLVPVGSIGTVYAISYDAKNKLMYAVVNPQTNDAGAQGFTIPLDGSQSEKWWIDHSGQSLPHDVSVSDDGSDIYVGEILSGAAIKLEKVRPHKAATRMLME